MSVQAAAYSLKMKRMSKMAIIWYEEYDFISNPFTIKPQESTEDFFGQQEIIKKLFANIKKGDMALVLGDFGTGKTTILKGIIDRYKGKRKVVYYNAYTSEKSIDYEDILVRGGSRLSSVFGIKSKDMILLLDEVHNFMKKDFENLVKYYYDGYFKSVILVTSEIGYKLPKEVMEIVKNNVYTLKPLAEEAAIKLVESRMEGVELLSKDIIKKILKKSKSPRDFMMRCDDACRKAVERGSDKVEAQDID